MEKTCGGCCKACKNGEQLTSVHCEIHHVTIDGDSRCYCGGEDFVGRTDTLEQRCQQLEQMAREIYQIIRVLERDHKQTIDPNPCNPLIPPLPSECCREDLEALGVSLDG